MTSAVNVRSQLIRIIFIFISFIIHCDGQTDCDPGKVFNDEDFRINCSITSRTRMIMIMILIIIIILAATGRNAGELSMNYFTLMIQTNPELMLRTVTCLNRLLSILSAK